MQRLTPKGVSRCFSLVSDCLAKGIFSKISFKKEKLLY